MVKGLDAGTVVVDVEETEEGYRLRFSDGSSILIKHGADGANGRPGKDAPTIGVRMDTDGVYYWTLTTDGVTEWLLDDEGNRMRVTGSDAATPVMGVDDEGYWTVSYDGGATFVRITDADGNPVPATPEETGDGIFTGFTQDEYYVYLTLADGSQIALPKSAARLDITFEQSERIACEPGQSVRIAYTVTGGDARTAVECLGKEGWSAEIERTDAASGFVVVTAPASKRNGKVLVFASSAGHTVMKTLTFGEGILTGIADTYRIDANGGRITIRVTTDLEYTVSIPDEAQAWLSAAVTRAELRTETLTFTVLPNTTGAERSATVALVGASGTVLQIVSVIQLAEVDSPEGNIVFADKTVKAACVAAYDTDGDGELSYEEAAAVKDLSALKLSINSITSFDELQYFTGITAIPYQKFWNQSSMRSIVLPAGVTLIDDRAFLSCSRLSNIVLPAGLTSIGEQAFEDCVDLGAIDLPDGITSIGGSAFKGCRSLRKIVFPANITDIEEYVCAGCEGLTEVILPEKLEIIGRAVFAGCARLQEISIPEGTYKIRDNAFLNCFHLAAVTLPSTITTIEERAFENCTALTQIVLPAKLLTLGKLVFSDCGALTDVYALPVIPLGIGDGYVPFSGTPKQNLHVPAASVEAYRAANHWKDFQNIIAIEESYEGITGSL